MSIPVRVKRAGKWWHTADLTIARAQDGNRRKVRLAIGEDLRIEVTSQQAVELANEIADLLEN